MRTLYLLRHAKSSWDDPSAADHERPLSPRGRRAATQISSYCARSAIRPSIVLCSSARRAWETLDAIRPALGEGADVIIEDSLYGADVPHLLDRLRRVPPAAEAVMVIAHNPGLEDLALHLAGDGDDDALRRLRAKYPTGALAAIDFSGADWSTLGASQGHLVSLVTPKDL